MQENPNQGNVKKLPEYGETQPPRNDIKEQRGGSQTDQRVGQTDKGADNQDAKGKNPRQ